MMGFTPPKNKKLHDKLATVLGAYFAKDDAPSEDNTVGYDGPGIYQHYKGGYYRVIGVGQHESTHARMVIYHSYNLEYDLPRMREHIEFVCRPLNAEDGPDPFNTRLANGQMRFVKIA
jgi:hypothetical protein